MKSKPGCSLSMKRCGGVLLEGSIKIAVVARAAPCRSRASGHLVRVPERGVGQLDAIQVVFSASEKRGRCAVSRSHGAGLFSRQENWPVSPTGHRSRPCNMHSQRHQYGRACLSQFPKQTWQTIGNQATIQVCGSGLDCLLAKTKNPRGPKSNSGKSRVPG